MSFDLSLVGYTSEEKQFEYDWQKVVLYALAIGARSQDLDYLYEGRGPKVYPSFAVIPAFTILDDLLAHTGVELSRIIHASQSIRLHGEIPPQGKLTTFGKIEAIYDLKRLSQIVFSTYTKLHDEPLFDTSWSIIVRGLGGFGGPRPPRNTAPIVDSGRKPDWEFSDQTRSEQALLYRLLGDFNPLHADPEIARQAGFEQGPILHGLCSFGFLTRAVIAGACAGNPRRLKALHAQFKKPVFPGDSLKTEGFSLTPGRVIVQTFAGSRAEPVISQAWAEISAE